jgi:hypothetical protein
MRMNNMLKSLGVLWFALTVLVACDTGENQTQVDYQSNMPNTPTNLVRYDREGGGQSSFTIADSDAFYNIHFTVHFTGVFKDIDTTLEISKSTIGTNVNRMLGGLFTGSQKISGTLYSTGVTGTWNYVYIQVGSNWIRIGNQDVIDALEPLEIQVDSLINFH